MGEKGQAYIEFLIVLPLIILFLVGIYFFSLIYIVYNQLNIAAKHGAWLIVHANYSHYDVKREIEKFLLNSKPSIDPSKIEIHRSGFGKVSIDVYYGLDVPTILARIKGFPENFYLRGRCVVYDDSWYFGIPIPISKS